MDTPIQPFLFPIGRWGFIRLYVHLLLSLQTRTRVGILPFSFPRAVVNAQLCVLSPSPEELGQLSVQAHQLSTKPHFHYSWRCTYGASHMVKMWGSLGIPLGQWGNSQARHPPAFHLQASWCYSLHSFQNMCPIDAFWEPWLLFFQFLPTPIKQQHLSVPDGEK